MPQLSSPALLQGSSAGELIPEIVRQGLLDLIELEVAAFIGADRHVDEVGRRPYAPAIGSATATATGLAASPPRRATSTCRSPNCATAASCPRSSSPAAGLIKRSMAW